MRDPLEPPDGHRDIVVVGAHLRGQPLNGQLTGLGATFVAEVRTAPAYKLAALPTEPPKPGLLRLAEGGASIVAERWRLTTEGFGAFVAAIPSPLTIGTLELDDGSRCQGFLCESYAVDAAPDITSFGGWRAYRESTPG
jgi:allophanate hydrolase